MLNNDKEDNVSLSLLKGLTRNQKEVLKIKSQNVLVNAGAGSGKTTVLTKRVIHLLKDEGYSLDDIIVLTFTDLAAKEMKDRIIKELKNEEDERLQNELAHIDEANILTFDAFCHKLIVKYNAYSNIDSSFSIGDDALFAMMKKEFISQNIRESYFYSSVYADEIIKVLGLTEPKQLVEKLSDMYDGLDSELDAEAAISNHYAHIIADDIYGTIIDKIENIIRFKVDRLSEIELIAIDEKTQNDIDNLNTIVENLKNAKDFEELFILLKQPLPRSPSLPREEDVFKPSRKRFKDCFDSIKEIVDPFDSLNEVKENFSKISELETVLLEILYKTHKDMNEFKREYNIYSFQDIAIECINMLNNHPEVCDYYKSHIKEILIDEYQDTNDTNSLLISLISNNNELVVGDVKQSIYRFRNANPDIFQNRYYLYKSNDKIGKVIDLDENFRSRKEEVVDIVNDIFVHLSKDESLNSKFFENKMVYGLKDYSNYPVNQDKFKIIEVDPDDEDHNEADYIAQDIINRLSNGQLKYDNHEKVLKKAELGDFLVLAYSSTNFDLYKKTFEKYGIPVKVSGEVSFSDSYEVVFIKNVLYLVYLLDANQSDNPSFDSTLISIMRSFVLNLKDNMILKYMSEKKKTSSLEALSKVLPNLYESFLELVDAYKNYGITSLINKINSKFRVYESLLKVDEKESREAKLNILVSQIETYAKSGMDLSTIVNYFEYLKKNKIDTSARITPLNDLSCLELMTIHKSKGLERPFVYVCDLKKALKTTQVDYSKEFSINLKIENNIKTILLKLEEKKEKNREFFRLLYVALTRARESLTLMFTSKEQSADKDIYNFSNLQQFLLYNHSFSDDVYTTVNIESKKKNKDAFIPSGDFKPIEYKTLNLKEKEAIIKTHASHDVIEIDEEMSMILEKGTLLHSFFEVTNFLSDDINKELENKKIADYYKKYLINFSKQPLFSTPSIREFHELPYYKDNSVGIIDYALEKDNVFIIVDFKTSNIDDPAYINQLSSYRSYLSTKTSKPIKTYLYSMLKNELKEIK